WCCHGVLSLRNKVKGPEAISPGGCLTVIKERASQLNSLAKQLVERFVVGFLRFGCRKSL
ncbi:hypothetical protein, partial [Pseudomonas botevensis]|uniref:hypothetical protein n=1 Tax=Pseudomonas botevensis TaxID=2842352 RepID=UPI001C3DEB3F